MDAHTLRVLEYDRVLSLIAGKTRSEAAHQKALELFPAADKEQAARALALTQEKESAVLAGFRRPWEFLVDLGPALRRLGAEGGRLETSELSELSRQLRGAKQVRHFFGEAEDRYPLSAGEVASLSLHSEIVSAIEAALDDEGGIRDNASPALRRLRRECERVRQQLEDKLKRVLRSPNVRDALQEEVVTIRNERMVIPVKAAHKNQVSGIVHDLSGSGQTVFMEPMSTVPLNNRLREIAREEEEEIERILQRLAELIRPAVPELGANGELLGEIDLQFAKAEFSREMECTRPLLRSDGGIRIVAGRHPLLVAAKKKEAKAQEDEVVPLDFSFDGDVRAMIITGPNTGGKTVALKTVGLFALMAQAGIPVPARDGTELSVFRQVFADVGDQQSIENDLSTFSSHLKEIAKVLRKVSPSSLVLLDELGAGTDPEEGAALAQAVLERLLAGGARVVATTHHGSLKMMAHLDPQMANASLEFDPDSLRPTYRFRQGIPGSSRGLDIAGCLGVPPEVVERARSIAGGDKAALERLLTDLDEELRRAREARLGAEESGREAEELRDRLAREEEAVRSEAKSRRRDARREAGAVVDEARSLVERLVGEIRGSQASRESVKEAGSALRELEKRLAEEERAERRRETPAFDPAELKPGCMVRIVSLNREGVVLARPSGGRARVQAGKLRLEVDLADLRPMGAQPVPAGAATGRPRGGITRPEGAGEDSLMGELDLRGFTADEALDSLDRHLDGALLAGYPQVRIIHGKGTGVLRVRVQEYLRDHPRVKSFRLGEWNEGGSGVTVAVLS